MNKRWLKLNDKESHVINFDEVLAVHCYTYPQDDREVDYENEYAIGFDVKGGGFNVFYHGRRKIRDDDYTMLYHILNPKGLCGQLVNEWSWTPKHSNLEVK